MLRKSSLWLMMMLALASCLVGCADDPIETTDVKRFDQKITEEEFQAYLGVLESFPNKKLPPLPPLFPPPPNWSVARSLPVCELTQVERKSIEEHMSVESLARNVPQSKAFQRALRKHRMSVEQFTGLTVALGMAMSRNELPVEEDFDKVLARGSQIIVGLEKDKRVFNLLAPDTLYYVLELAAWIPLVDRLKRMKKVPTENCELVRKHREQLELSFPIDFRQNPLQGLVKLLEDESLPFTDPGGNNPDDRIVWNREAALIGTDGITVPLKTTQEPAALLPVPSAEALE